MKTMSYAEKLKHPKWQKLRLQVLEKYNWQCCLCKDKETTLHVHHMNYEAGKDPWEYQITNFRSLCENCHKEVEFLKKRGEFDFEQLNIVKLTFSNGDKLVFFKYKDSRSINIYNDNSHVIGYNVPESRSSDISKFFKK